MRIVLDENVPEAIVMEIGDHECAHVIRLGWAGIKNGALLTMAEQAGFQVLLTFDKGIPSQHNIAGRKLAIVVLQPEGQGVRAVRGLLKDLLRALAEVQAGEVRFITNR